MSHFPIITLPTFNDSRGSLTVLERALPFEIARIYWIYGANGQTRGGHRHKVTRQALIAINGSVSLYLNDGVTEETVVLSEPSQCLLVEPKVWHTMTFGENAVLLVLASHPYDRTDYIDTPYERASYD
ncbi:MAG: FdtA/QdtA family cupin domain-containing protein [Burkholderiales bacterium]|jgi:dTDP-4-dehydrorhamnose 3,5-epimerase-like enzyme|nr:FdtA/QdtA family cupin domain-containing protein [Burkholderiales bacterium]